MAYTVFVALDLVDLLTAFIADGAVERFDVLGGVDLVDLVADLLFGNGVDIADENVVFTG